MTPPVDVLVVGAGPTGLALALQAHDHGARVRIVERRPQPFRPSRAMLMHARTLEVLRPLGVVEALLAHANIAPYVRFHLGAQVVGARLNNVALPDTAFPHLTLLRQTDVETALAEALADRGVPVERGVELVGLDDRGDEPVVTLRSPAGVEVSACRFVAGCDGPASTVRAQAGIAWRGDQYAEEVILADIELDNAIAPGVAHVAIRPEGLLFVFPLGERATWRMLATRRRTDDAPTVGQPGPAVPAVALQALLDGAGLGAQIRSLVWSARYTLQHRLAARFRRGRLFVAGDAAHAFSPATGQGMNTGIQDAINLGWKLAFAPASSHPSVLLDSYTIERRAVARQVLAVTHLAFWAEASAGHVPAFLRGVLAPLAAPLAPALLRRPQLIARAVRLLAQFWVAYPDSPLSREGTPRLTGGPAVGRRLPDGAVDTNGRHARLHDLLARPGVHVFLHRDASPLPSLAANRHVTIHRLTSVAGAGMLAIRPDGYVGFRCGAADDAQLRAWLAHVGASP